ncbi:hypothetical protein ABZX75_17450 [Streptomyces sp. NPDC003038]|uniref:hypothetical protein n=1 Tax=unclassified Streptomyces TaxID=2593676 RepID=UPI0033B1EAFE
MSTSIFDRIATDGTGDGHAVIRMADGHRITLTTRPGSPFGIDEAFLWPGVDAPCNDSWANEDSVELWLTAGDTGQDGGRLFYEVPVEDVRALIEEHGGEHADQSPATDDEIRELIAKHSA